MLTASSSKLGGATMTEIETTEQSEKSSVGCTTIILGFTVFFTLLMGVIIGLQVLEDEVWLVPGNPDKFDPIANYEEISSYAGENASLLQIESYYVRSDGTLDLNASYEPAPSVFYTFYRQTGTIDADAPTGVTVEDAINYRYVWVRITAPFQWTFATQGVAGEGVGYDLNLGMDRDRSVEQVGIPEDSIPAPQCAYSELWQTALAESDADPNAVATIIYNASGYLFTITGTPISLQFDTDCTLIN